MIEENGNARQGCEHNILREWHGVQTGVRWVPTFTKKKPHYRKEYTYQPGDLITLRCPKGCPDIYITVKSNK